MYKGLDILYLREQSISDLKNMEVEEVSMK